MYFHDLRPTPRLPVRNTHFIRTRNIPDYRGVSRFFKTFYIFLTPLQLKCDEIGAGRKETERTDLVENVRFPHSLDYCPKRKAETGYMPKGGTVVDAIIISASPSTKNAEKQRDPEIHRTKKCSLLCVCNDVFSNKAAIILTYCTKRGCFSLQYVF